MVFISLASIGLPGLNGFVGEVLSLAGMFQRHPLYAVLGTTGVVLGAWYLLTMLQHAFFGRCASRTTATNRCRDMNLREALALAPICVLCLWIGVRPQPLIDTDRAGCRCGGGAVCRMTSRARSRELAATIAGQTVPRVS